MKRLLLALALAACAGAAHAANPPVNICDPISGSCANVVGGVLQTSGSGSSSGTGTQTPIPAPAANGTPLAAGLTGTRMYLAPGDSVTFAVETAATCGASAPAATYTVSGPSNWDENLSGVIVCVTAKSGSPSYRAY